MKQQSVEGIPHPNNVKLPESAMAILLADIFAQEIDGINDTLNISDKFDPIEIRDLIRRAASAGKHPAQLILGQSQTEAYRDFLWIEYGEEPPENLRDHYFLGLQVVPENVPDKLALAGEKEHDAWDSQLPPIWQDDDSPSNTPQAA